MKQFDFSKKNITSKGRRFVPEYIIFHKHIRDLFPGHFKIYTNSEGESKLYISALMKNALDKINRGRTSRDTIQKDLSGLIKLVSEKIPAKVRAILKNNIGKSNPSINMFPVNSKIANVIDGNIEFFNPSNPKNSDLSVDKNISEKKTPLLIDLVKEIFNYHG